MLGLVTRGRRRVVTNRAVHVRVWRCFVAQRLQMGVPFTAVRLQPHTDGFGEPGGQLFVGKEPWIVGIKVARVVRGVRVPKEQWVVSMLARHSRDIGRFVFKGRAVANCTVV